MSLAESTTPTQSPDYSAPVLDSILLATDFTEGSLTAFHHALKAALISKCVLTVLHVADGGPAGWTEFPGVRETLERWRLLPPNSPKSAVPELGIDVRKTVARDRHPVKAVLKYMETHPANLIVLASHTHEGRATWLRESVAEPVSRKAGQMTLFIPDGARGFVSAETGEVSLNRILIPIASKPAAGPALAAAARLAMRLERERGTFVLLFVGDESQRPVIKPPDVPGWLWQTVNRKGDVIEGILEEAKKERTDLIVMSTDGRNGFLDALRGSHSERVLRGAPCPVLTVPEGSLAGGALA